MRIALDCSYSVDAEPSGIAIYSRELINGLPAEHPQDRFFACYRPKQFASAPRPNRPNVSRRILLPPLPTFRADVLHALNQRVDQRAGRLVISTFHDLFVMTGEYSTPEFRARFTKQAREAAERSDVIIAVSEFTADQVANLLGVKRKTIRVVRHGVKPGAASDQLSTTEREKIILFVGALQARKNVARLVAAFEAVPEPWRLVLAGSQRGYRSEEILEQITRSRCRDRIQVTGYVSAERLADLFSRAMIFAFPSLDEGFGIPVLEAMAANVPVLTSNGSALKEIAGEAALLVDPYRVEDIAAGLRSLTDNEDLREKLKLTGKLRVVNFSWKRTVAETYCTYKQLS